MACAIAISPVVHAIQAVVRVPIVVSNFNAELGIDIITYGCISQLANPDYQSDTHSLKEFRAAQFRRNLLLMAQKAANVVENPV